MTLSRLRVVLAFGALALVQTYGCDSSPIGTDGGADATAGASQGAAGSAGPKGTAGASGTAGHGGSSGTAGHAGSAGASGSAGATGTAGHGGASCSDLQSQYGDALAAARSCSVTTSGQCTQTASGELSPCFSNCLIFVNDATTLDALKTEWLQAGCADGTYACPAIACEQPPHGECVAGDGGGAVCQASQLGIE